MNFSNNQKIGVLGGGQLGRMFIQNAVNLDITVHVLDPSPIAPCKDICAQFTQGSFKDFDAVYNFGKGLDIITIEIESVNTDALIQLEKEGVRVHPSAAVIQTIKDKGLQKEFYQKHEIPSAAFYLVDTPDQIKENTFPVVQKLRTDGYDGRGVQLLRSKENLNEAFDAPSVIEELIDIHKEISVIVARNQSGELKTFPVVEQVFNTEHNILDYLLSPAQITTEQAIEADRLAQKIAEKLKLVGILAVEMFIDQEGKLWVNEAAPRPHNSGHQTIEANYTSQYEQLLRAILDLPLGDTSIIMPSAMVNLLGEPEKTGLVNYQGLASALKTNGVYPHLYGKKETKPFRKMGHVTVVAPSLEEVIAKADQIKNQILVTSTNE